jgi:hypothetical protein
MQNQNEPMTLKVIFEQLQAMKDEDLDSPTEDQEVASLRWYEQYTVEAYREITETSERSYKDKQRILQNSIPEYYTPIQKAGTMWSFLYEAESDRLQFWDRIPLVLRMIDNKDDTNTFMGMNLHYLYPRYRKVLLLSLLRRVTGDLENENARITKLNSSSLFKFPDKYGRACIRRYKYDNIRRKPIRIPPEHWLKMIYLPTYHFVGGRPNKVWAKTYETMKKMGLTKR